MLKARRHEVSIATGMGATMVKKGQSGREVRAALRPSRHLALWRDRGPHNLSPLCFALAGRKYLFTIVLV